MIVRELRFLALISMIVILTVLGYQGGNDGFIGGFDIVLVIAAIGATLGLLFIYFTNHPIGDDNQGD